jgi:hypothetical protein
LKVSFSIFHRARPQAARMMVLTPIRARFASLSPHLDERECRLLAATEARLAGYGGIAAVTRATGVAASNG